MSLQDASFSVGEEAQEAVAPDQGAESAHGGDSPDCPSDVGAGGQQQAVGGTSVHTRTNPPPAGGPTRAAPVDAHRAIAVVDRLEAEAAELGGTAAVGREEASLLRSTLEALSRRTAQPGGEPDGGRTQKEMVRKFECVRRRSRAGASACAPSDPGNGPAVRTNQGSSHALSRPAAGRCPIYMTRRSSRGTS